MLDYLFRFEVRYCIRCSSVRMGTYVFCFSRTQSINILNSIKKYSWIQIVNKKTDKKFYYEEVKALQYPKVFELLENIKLFLVSIARSFRCNA